MRVRRDHKGFTIIELLVSTVVFSMVLLAITAGVISFSRSYYKGVTSSHTQSVARAIMAEVSQGIQFSKDNRPAADSDTNNDAQTTHGYCAGNKLISYRKNIEVSANPIVANHQDYHALVVQDTSCTTAVALYGASTLPSGARELLGENMRITKLDVTDLPISGSTSAKQVTVRVVFGHDDVLTTDSNGNTVCTNNVGSQFCAVSELSTTVRQRL